MAKSEVTSENQELFNTEINVLKEAFFEFEAKNYDYSYQKLKDAHQVFNDINMPELVSVCLSFMALTEYLGNKKTYYEAFLVLEEARFLAAQTESGLATIVNKLAFAQVFLNEGNYIEALLYLDRLDFDYSNFPYVKLKVHETMAICNLNINNIEKAKMYLNIAHKIAEEENYEQILEKLETIKTEIMEKCGDTKTTTTPAQDPMIAMLKIARTISAETNLDSLLKTIAEQTKLVLNADRCSVFLIDKEHNELYSRVALGVDDEKEIRFPIDKGLAGHVAMTGETIHIKDAYNDDRFNKEIDLKTGYVTRNILCMPIRNSKFEVIGVFQVLNKFDGEFTKKDEDLLITIGSSAGISLENNFLINNQQKMIKEQKLLFDNFIEALAASIDAKDKITAGHSQRVNLYAVIIAEQLKLNKVEIEKIAKAAKLHDIGKIGIRDAVLQKEGKLTPEEYEHIKLHVKITHDILSKISSSKEFDEIVEIASSHHEKYDKSGYFRHLSSSEIHFGGRILAVADVFDAITSRRHYRDKMPIKNALDIIIESKENHFDPKVVEAFFDVTCDKFISVFLTEYEKELPQNDKNILANYKMIDLYRLLNNDNIENSDQEFVNLFIAYYTNKSQQNTQE